MISRRLERKRAAHRAARPRLLSEHQQTPRDGLAGGMLVIVLRREGVALVTGVLRSAVVTLVNAGVRRRGARGVRHIERDPGSSLHVRASLVDSHLLFSMQMPLRY